MPVRLAAALGVALCAVALAGCRDTPPTTPKAVAAEAAGDPRAEGDAAAQRGDWTTATARYADAVQRTPDDWLLRFALGSAYSHLDRTAEVIEQFVWVVEHGDPSRAEVAAARQWLRQTGALPAATETTTRTDTASPADAAPPAGTGVLAGKTSWPGLDRHMPLKVRLRGETEATKDARDRVTIALGKPFTFPKVKAGEYRLIGEAGGVAVWDLPITVEPDKTTSVDLSPVNSSAPAGSFPPRG